MELASPVRGDGTTVSTASASSSDTTIQSAASQDGVEMKTMIAPPSSIQDHANSVCSDVDNVASHSAETDAVETGAVGSVKAGITGKSTMTVGDVTYSSSGASNNNNGMEGTSSQSDSDDTGSDDDLPTDKGKSLQTHAPRIDQIPMPGTAMLGDVVLLSRPAAPTSAATAMVTEWRELELRDNDSDNPAVIDDNGYDTGSDTGWNSIEDEASQESVVLSDEERHILPYNTTPIRERHIIDYHGASDISQTSAASRLSPPLWYKWIHAPMTLCYIAYQQFTELLTTHTHRDASDEDIFYDACDTLIVEDEAVEVCHSQQEAMHHIEVRIAKAPSKATGVDLCVEEQCLPPEAHCTVQLAVRGKGLHHKDGAIYGREQLDINQRGCNEHSYKTAYHQAVSTLPDQMDHAQTQLYQAGTQSFEQSALLSIVCNMVEDTLRVRGYSDRTASWVSWGLRNSFYGCEIVSNGIKGATSLVPVALANAVYSMVKGATQDEKLASKMSVATKFASSSIVKGNPQAAAVSFAMSMAGSTIGSSVEKSFREKVATYNQTDATALHEEVQQVNAQLNDAIDGSKAIRAIIDSHHQRFNQTHEAGQHFQAQIAARRLRNTMAEHVGRI